MNANEASENRIDRAIMPPSPLHTIKHVPEKHRKLTERDPIPQPSFELATIVELQIAM
jgi:hypothetical protein